MSDTPGGRGRGALAVGTDLVKLVVAIIHAFKLDEVCAALEQAGVTAMTVTDARGFGRQKPPPETYRGADFERQSVPRVRLEAAVRDETAERVVATILSAARTDRVGDGRVFLIQLDDVARIRDGQRGPTAV